MIYQIFLADTNIDLSQNKTPREVYFQQLGKSEELKRFCDLSDKDLDLSKLSEEDLK